MVKGKKCFYVELIRKFLLPKHKMGFFSVKFRYVYFTKGFYIFQ